ncbi:unnamed protein product, partial [Iphiclides podalirius]
MRLSLAAVVICASCCLCYDAYEDTRVMARAYPAQVKIPFHRKIHILNAQKSKRSPKALPTEINRHNNKKRYLTAVKDSYTVFPPIGMRVKKVNDFPESPFFPLDALFDQKPNKVIKKMLPDYGLQHLRLKRSVGNTKASVNGKTTKKIDAKTKDKKAETKSMSNKTIDKSRVARKQNPGGANSKSKSLKRRTSRVPVNKAKIQKKQPANPPKEPTNTITKNKRTADKRNLRTQNKANRPSKQSLRSGPSRHNRNPKSSLRSRPNKVKRSGKQKSKAVKRPQAQRDRKVNVGRRLIAGRDAMIEDYPYVVSIQKAGEHWCAGALLNPRLVITTANCVWKSERVARLRVRAGTRHSDRGGQVARVQEMMRHPGWSIRNIPDNDVALLLLDKSIRFSHDVHAVDLPNLAMMPAFDDAWVTSWGSDRRDGIYDRGDLSLQAYQGRLMDRQKCNNVTERFGVYVTHNFFCMTQAGRRSPCTRDTGAPAVSDGVLWGLASWGIRKSCGTERFPAMFTYIAADSIMNFIKNATHLLMSDERFYPYLDRLTQYGTFALWENKNQKTLSLYNTPPAVEPCLFSKAWRQLPCISIQQARSNDTFKMKIRKLKQSCEQRVFHQS